MSGIALFFIALTLILLSLFIRKRAKQDLQSSGIELTERTSDSHAQEKTSHSIENSGSSSHKPSMKELLKSEAHSKKMLKNKKKVNPHHNWFVKGYKGFSDGITDFDIHNDGLILVASSLDKTFRVYKSKSIEDDNPATGVCKIDFVYANAISISEDCKTIACGLDSQNSVKIYNVKGLDKFDDDDAKISFDLTCSFEKNLHKTQIHSLFLDKGGKFVITSSEENDTTIKAWSIDGDNLMTFNNNQLKNYKFYPSYDGKFVGIASWAPDVRILEMKKNKDGSFKTLTKAMELKGHRLSVYGLGFNENTDKVVTISKDNTIKIWNIQVQYELSEDPKCIKTLDITKIPDLATKTFDTIAIYSNPDEKLNLICLSFENNLIFYDYEKETTIEIISNAHNEGFKINKLLFKFIKNDLYLFSSSNDSRINLWKVQVQFKKN